MTTCSSCQSPKANLNCGLCKDPLCKACAQILDAEAFLYSKGISRELLHKAYCVPCFDEKIASQLRDYNTTLEKAKNVYVFTKAQSKETRLLKRKAPAIKVENCSDEDDATMKLAFQAAEQGFNAIVDMSLTSKKYIENSYQTTKWAGTAIPTNVDVEKIEQGHPTVKNPN